MTLHALPTPETMTADVLDMLDVRDLFVDERHIITVSHDGRYLVHLTEAGRSTFVGRFDDAVSAWEALDAIEAGFDETRLPLAA